MRTRSPSASPRAARIVGMHRQLDVGPGQLAERRADRALARRRDERQRIALGGRIRLKAIEAHRRARVERRRETDRPCGPACSETRRRTGSARCRTAAPGGAPARRSSPIVPGQRVEHARRIRSSSPVGSSSLRARPSRAHSSPNTSAFDRASPTASMTGRAELEADRPVRLGEIVALEERRRRQHDVGVERRVGHHLLEDDGEEILALEAAEDAPLVGHRRRRIAVVDEQHVDGRVVVLGQRAAEMVHVDEARVAAPARRSTVRSMSHDAELLIE